MAADLPPVPGPDLRRHLLGALGRYWPDRAEAVARAPVRELPFPEVRGPLRLVLVPVPAWAEPWAVEGRLAAPREACADPDRPSWDGVDWWLAAFLLLEGWHERAWERDHGPVHSYGFRLRGWDGRAWERAWVNRIALCLRAWGGTDPGPVPAARLLLTHDVDALDLTLPIRLKQGSFNLINAARALGRGRLREAGARLRGAGRFLAGAPAGWSLGDLLEREARAGIRSRFHVFAGDPGFRRPGRWLLDPGYRPGDPRLGGFYRTLRAGGWSLGLHPGYDAWADPDALRAQKAALEAASGAEVSACRQHWLRFSWAETWAAQEAAGLRQDTTLMFNDRPGLRGSAALAWCPWDPGAGRARVLEALPTILMDSHVYDYRPLAPAHRRAAMAQWLEEVGAVGGEAALLWHPHTLGPEYGWGEGFEELLAALAGRFQGRDLS